MSPLSRVKAGHAMGNSVHNVTERSESRSESGEVAAATMSCSATQSGSDAIPANGRTTRLAGAAAVLPWQALYRRPLPHGHGSRPPTTAISSRSADWFLVLVAFAGLRRLLT